MLTVWQSRAARRKFSAKRRVADSVGYGAGDDYRAAVCGVSEYIMPENVFLVIASLATFATVGCGL